MSQVLRRHLIRQLGLTVNQSVFLDSSMASPRADVARLALYSGAVESEFALPLDGSPAKTVFRPRYLYALQDAIVDPLTSLVYDADGRFIAESSSWWPLRQFYVTPQPKISRPRDELLGEYILLPNNTYYHWLIEDLPVFVRAYAASAADSTLLVAKAARPYVAELAEFVDRERIALSRPARVERLLMVGKTAGMGSLAFGLTPHPADSQTLRTFFSRFLDEPSSGRRLYLSRSGQRRSRPNDEELEDWLMAHGFEVFDGHGLSVFEQMRLFRSATIIVGMHGAAFSNIVWCRERTKLIEIFNPTYVPSCYAALASMNKLEYESHILQTAPNEGARWDDVFAMVLKMIEASDGQVDR